MRAALASAALAAALTGCRDDRAPAPDIPATPLAASLNGAPFPITTVLATSWGGRAVELHFASLPITCADALANGYAPRPGERRLDVTIAPVASEGGAWHVVQVSSFPINREAKMGRAIVTAADASPGQHTTARIRVDAAWTMPGDPPAHLVAAGAVDAIGCGVKKIHDAKARPQAVDLQVGPTRVPVNGATLRRSGTRLELALGNAPFDCDHDVPEGDARLELTLLEEGSWAVSRVALRGDLLGDQLDTTVMPGTRGFVVKPIEGRDADFEVSGSMAVHGVPTAIGGVVSALRCAR
jgi:hypothetical protein